MNKVSGIGIQVSGYGSPESGARGQGICPIRPIRLIRLIRPIALVIAVACTVVLATPASSATWLTDNFDSYTTGNLVPQGGWDGGVSAVRVQTVLAESGKAIEGNYLSWGPGDANLAVSSGGGSHIIEFDAAMDTGHANYSQNLGYLMIFNQSGAEITRVYYAHQEFKVLVSPGVWFVIQPNVVARQWYHIKIAIDLNTRRLDVWVDNVQKLTNGTTYSAGTSINQITFGQWNSVTGFTKSETYLDNLVCYTGAPTPVATLLKQGDGWSGWECKNLFDPFVIYDSGASNYKMYYASTGMAEFNDSAWDQRAILIGTSTDTLNWARKIDDYEPVLYPRKFHQGDLVRTGENAAIFDSMWACSPCVIQDGDGYKMYYTGWNGETEHVGGGIENKINFRIGVATSDDMIAWTKQTQPTNNGAVLGLGSTGSQDAKGVSDPYVLKEDSSYRMWYEGFDGGVWRIFYATSTDGITWSRQGVALTPGGSGTLDELGVRSPAVIFRNGQYELWYQGRSSSSPNYHIMRATSADGITWSKVGEVSLHPSDSVDSDEQISVGSVVVKPDNSCQVFFSKQNTANLTVTYGTILDRSFCIYAETMTP